MRDKSRFWLLVCVVLVMVASTVLSIFFLNRPDTSRMKPYKIGDIKTSAEDPKPLSVNPREVAGTVATPSKPSTDGDEDGDYYILPKGSIAFASSRDLMHLWDLRYSGDFAPIKGYVNDLIRRGRAVEITSDSKVEIIDALTYEAYGNITRINVKGTTAQGWVNRSDLLIPINKLCERLYSFYTTRCVPGNDPASSGGSELSSIIHQARNRLNIDRFSEFCAAACTGNEPRVSISYFRSIACAATHVSVPSGSYSDDYDTLKRRDLEERRRHADMIRAFQDKLHNARQ